MQSQAPLFCTHCQLPLANNLPLLRAKDKFCSFGCKQASQHKNFLETPLKSPLIYKLFLGALFVILLFLLEVFLNFRPDLQPGTPTYQMLVYTAFVMVSLVQIVMGLPLYFTIFATTHPAQRTDQLAALASILVYAFSSTSVLRGAALHLFALPALLIVLIWLKSLMQTMIQRKSTAMLAPLFAMRVPTAFKSLGDSYGEVPTQTLVPGDKIKIKPGMRIPTDGLILSGTTSIDESLLTGEFRPLLKGKGESVVGATLNRDSEILVRVTKEYKDTVLELVLSSLQKGRAKSFSVQKGPLALFSFLTPFILLLAAGALAYHGFYLGLPLEIAGQRVLAVLIIVSPGTLAVLAHMSFAIILTETVQKGIYLANPAALKTLADVNLMFFDKTGTFTKGTFAFSQLFLEHGTNQGEFLATLFSLEKPSAHPIAKAMGNHPWYNEIAKHPVRDFKSHAGLGVCGTMIPHGRQDSFAAVGNLRLLKRMQMQITRDMKFKIDELESLGETVILCGYRGQVRGLISFADVLRPETRQTLEELKNLKVEPAILTGDTEEGILHIIRSIGINKVYARCTPEEKAAKIKKAKEEGFIVGLVGDDTRERPARKEAHVALAIDTGTNFDDHTADAIIMGSNFTDIAWLTNKAKVCFNTLRFNVSMTIIYAFITLPLAFFGFIPPILAALIMTSFSVLQMYSIVRIKEKGNQLLESDVDPLSETLSTLKSIPMRTVPEFD